MKIACSSSWDLIETWSGTFCHFWLLVYTLYSPNRIIYFSLGIARNALILPYVFRRFLELSDVSSIFPESNVAAHMTMLPHVPAPPIFLAVARVRNKLQGGWETGRSDQALPIYLRICAKICFKLRYQEKDKIPVFFENTAVALLITEICPTKAPTAFIPSDLHTLHNNSYFTQMASQAFWCWSIRKIFKGSL